jgi:putative membrane protein
MLSARNGCGIYFGGAALAVAFAAASDERTFIKEAVQGNIIEVQLTELAAQRAESEDVRKLAQMLRQDHHATLQRAKAVAKSLEVEAPTEPSNEAKGYYDGLAQMSGCQFDAAFLSHMVVLHEAEIANYARNASSDDDAVASFVADALPKLKAHLSATQAVQQGRPPTRGAL